MPAKISNPPKISVVIPSYNKVKYIGETLASIVNQGYANYEVIIQDGGSSDGTLEVIKKYASKFPRNITWVSHKDKGQLDAVNKGMKRASGDILTYINADDIYLPNAFSEVSNIYLKDSDCLWYAGKSILVDERGRKVDHWLNTLVVARYKDFLLRVNRYKFLLVVNYLMQPSMFITRVAFEKYGPFTGVRNFIMEYEMWLKIGKTRMPVVIDKNLACFRMSTTNITSTKYRDLLTEDMKVAKKYTNNLLVLFFHWLNNFIRCFVIRILPNS